MQTFVVVIGVVLLGVGIAQAQSVEGTVTDQTGAVLPGVTVRAVPSGGGLETTVVSDANGQYRLVLPATGSFDVSFVLSGFVEQHARRTQVGDTQVTLNAALPITSFGEQIRVAADLADIQSTGSRLGLTRQEMPASVDVVTQDVIQARGADTASTALRYVTGVTSSLRPGASAVFSSRGFIENSLGVLFNGVRVQSSTVTMRNYDAFNFDRVEVLRGPASVLHGEGLATGAVNFVRREAVPGRQRVDALLEAGDAGHVRFGAAAAGPLARAAATPCLLRATASRRTCRTTSTNTTT